MLPKRSHLIAALVSAVLFLGAASAQAGYLLNEDFNDVTGSNTGAALGPNGNRAVSAILANRPGELPPGTTQSTSPLSNASVSVRRGDNLINTSASPGGFDSFFDHSIFAPRRVTGNNFLVLGDTGLNGVDANGKPIQDPLIGGPPDAGIFSIMFPFIRPSGAIVVLFDWAFNGVDTSSDTADIASVDIVGDTELSLLSLRSPNAFGSGTFNETILASALPTGNLKLRFRLSEAAGVGTNTAFAIDNVRIVPEPSTFALLAIALAGLGALRRRDVGYR